jgi:hypothetical protein
MSLTRDANSSLLLPQQHHGKMQHWCQTDLTWIWKVALTVNNRAETTSAASAPECHRIFFTEWQALPWHDDE